jgi:RHS repeat-associated protein
LLEIDPFESSLTKTYIYVADPPSLGRADRQILAQHDGDISDDKYFYLHDRLGSVRLVIDDQGAVKNTYTYEPFGQMLASECTENVSNPFKFTGQYFDSEIEEYYLRARQYNPHIARFTSRDPVKGSFKVPLTLRQYLYCINNPVNRIDPAGELSLTDISVTQAISSGIRGWQAFSYTRKAYAFARHITAAADLRDVMLATLTLGLDIGQDYATGKLFNYGLKGLGKLSASLAPNDLHHIFAKPGHKLGPILGKFGGSIDDAGRAVEDAFQEAVDSGVYAGQDVKKGIVISVAGELAVVKGNIVDGVARVGTFFIP